MKELCYSYMQCIMNIKYMNLYKVYIILQLFFFFFLPWLFSQYIVTFYKRPM